MKNTIGMLILATLAAGPVQAHHGFGRFDMSTEIEIEGTLTDLDFVNPHSYVYFDAVAEDGSILKMGCEMRAATVLRRSGWSPDLFVEGAHIRITGNPHRDDPSSCYVETLAIGDAPVLERYQQLSGDTDATKAKRPARLPDGTPNIFGDWAQEQYLLATPKAADARARLVPKSMVEGIESGAIDPAEAPDPGWGARAVTLTGAGETAAEALRQRTPDEDPRINCETTSILFDWVFDGPINRISRNGEQIKIEYGRGLVRMIHMNQSGDSRAAPSRGGHSVGRWEGDTLVVETGSFLPGSIAGTVPHSGELRVVERFSLGDGGLALKREYVAEDPLYFEGSYSGSDTVLLADAPFAVDQCKELAYEYTTGTGEEE